MALYGPDGAGKSTQVAILSEKLTKQGYKVKKVWLRGPHTLAYLFSVVLLKLGRRRQITNPYGRVKTLPDIGVNPLIKQLWAFIEFISVLPLIFIKVMVPLWMGRFIVADRYILDVIVSTAFYVNDLSYVDKLISGVLLKLIPGNCILIHLDTDYDTLLLRRERLVEPRSFIDFQKEAYALLDKKINVDYIDTSKLTIEETSEAIEKLLLSYKVL